MSQNGAVADKAAPPGRPCTDFFQIFFAHTLSQTKKLKVNLKNMTLSIYFFVRMAKTWRWGLVKPPPPPPLLGLISCDLLLEFRFTAPYVKLLNSSGLVA